jgi:hypothetical protein
VEGILLGLQLYQHREAYGAMKDVYVEFIDVGGHTKYELSRAMFYHDVQGLVLVHDLSNAKSYDHLRQWMSEINETQRRKGCVLPPSYAHRSTDFPTVRLACLPCCSSSTVTKAVFIRMHT